MNDQVTKYIAAAPAEQKQLMQQVRAIIHKEVPGIIENFKWGRPIFSTTSDLVYFKTTKAYLTVGFFTTKNITDEHNLLEGTGKDMRHIKLKTAGDLKPEIITKWLHQLAQS